MTLDPARCETCDSDNPAICEASITGHPHPHDPDHCCDDPFHFDTPPPLQSTEEARSNG